MLFTEVKRYTTSNRSLISSVERDAKKSASKNWPREIHACFSLTGSRAAIFFFSRSKRKKDYSQSREKITIALGTYLTILAKKITCPPGFRVGSGAAQIQAWPVTLNPGRAPPRLGRVHSPGNGLSAGGLLGGSCQKQGEGIVSCIDTSTQLDMGI